MESVSACSLLLTPENANLMGLKQGSDVKSGVLIREASGPLGLVAPD